jgi:hypothetical protein
MRLNCLFFIGETMCLNCGDCTKQHQITIDDSIDLTEMLPMRSEHGR